jgi:hypothetical protein
VRTSEIVLAAGLALSATAGMAAGVAAQQQSDTGSITVAQGTVAGEPFDVSLAEWDDETGQMTGLALSIVVDSTDPRLAGTLSMASTGAGERYGEGGIIVMRSAYRLANADGVWLGEGWEVEARPRPDQPATFRNGVMVLEGADAYEGMTAYVSVSYEGEVPMTDAVIIEATLPPEPDPTALLTEHA